MFSLLARCRTSKSLCQMLIAHVMIDAMHDVNKMSQDDFTVVLTISNSKLKVHNLSIFITSRSSTMY